MTEARARVEQVYREHGPRLWRALVGFTGDPEIASEARAEAFAQALARGDAIRSPADWIWTAAFRIASGQLKERGSRTSAAPESSYELAEPVDHLVQALSRLPARQRMAIVLHDYADRPTEEIAAVMGVTRATVHVHLSAGRKRLRHILEEEPDA